VFYDSDSSFIEFLGINMVNAIRAFFKRLYEFDKLVRVFKIVFDLFVKFKLFCSMPLLSLSYPQE
jgi:hypothetical protein